MNELSSVKDDENNYRRGTGKMKVKNKVVVWSTDASVEMKASRAAEERVTLTQRELEHPNFRRIPVSLLPKKVSGRKSASTKRPVQGFFDHKKQDPFPGEKPLSKEQKGRVKDFDRGGFSNPDGVRQSGAIEKMNFLRKEERKKMVSEEAVRMDVLLTEEHGFLEAEREEETFLFQQSEIKAAVDVTAAAKSFDLDLRQFGPYRINYSRNGRHLLLGGAKSHVAAIDWVTKDLKCEMTVMESVHDVQWLHNEMMFAVAQKEWVYIYDNTGIELHALKRLDRVLRMEFLPYHFLLATASERGFLSWLDVSIGRIVNQFPVKGMPRLDMLVVNPWNACLGVGLPNGTVGFYSPNVKDPLAKMLVSPQPLKSMAIDARGQYMATSGSDQVLRIWDVRALKQLRAYKLPSAVTHLNFSQTGLLACGVGNVIDIYRDMCTAQVETPYLRHKCHRPISQIAFAPYEDVLGIGHFSGFSSILVPGAGEPNFDAFESNPYQSKKQRREAEVKALLEKIQPELITLDPAQVAKVDREALEERLAEQEKLLHLHPRRSAFEPRRKHKSKGGSAKLADVKAGVREEKKRRFLKRQRTQQILVANKKARKKKTDGGRAGNQKVKGEDTFDPLKRFRKKEKKPILKPESDNVR